MAYGSRSGDADYAAFKEKYGRAALAAEGAAVMKFGDKPGKVVGAVMILAAVAFGNKPRK